MALISSQWRMLAGVVMKVRGQNNLLFSFFPHLLSVFFDIYNFLSLRSSNNTFISVPPSCDAGAEGQGGKNTSRSYYQSPSITLLSSLLFALFPHGVRAYDGGAGDGNTRMNEQHHSSMPNLSPKHSMQFPFLYPSLPNFPIVLSINCDLQFLAF